MTVARTPLSSRGGCDGRLSMISATRSAGGGGFDNDEAVRSENVRTEKTRVHLYTYTYIGQIGLASLSPHIWQRRDPI